MEDDENKELEEFFETTFYDEDIPQEEPEENLDDGEDIETDEEYENIVKGIDDILEKQIKVYLEEGEKPPEGVQIQQGPKGGKYYIGRPGETEKMKEWKRTFRTIFNPHESDYMKFPFKSTDDVEGMIGKSRQEIIDKIVRGSYGRDEPPPAAWDKFAPGINKTLNFINFYIKLAKESSEVSNEELDRFSDNLFEDIKEYKEEGRETSVKEKINHMLSWDIMPALKYGDRKGKIIAIDQLIAISHRVEPTIIPHISGISAVQIRVILQDIISVVLDKLAEEENKMEKSFVDIRKQNRIKSAGDIIKSLNSILETGQKININKQDLSHFESQASPAVKESFDELMKQEKVYFQPDKGEKAPEGVDIKEGPKGGKYYTETEHEAMPEYVKQDILTRAGAGKPGLSRDELGTLGARLVYRNPAGEPIAVMLLIAEPDGTLRVGNIVTEGKSLLIGKAVKAITEEIKNLGVKIPEKIEMTPQGLKIAEKFAQEHRGKEPPGIKIADELGIKYDGIQEGVGMEFTDPETGSTFYGNTLEEVQKNLANMRRKFAQSKRTPDIKKAISGFNFKTENEIKDIAQQNYENWTRQANNISSRNYRIKKMAINSQRIFKDIITKSYDNKVFVSERDKIYGAAAFNLENNILSIECLCTSPDSLEKQGIGTLLVYYILKTGLSKGVDRIQLTPESFSSGFYEKLGFKFNKSENLNIMYLDEEGINELINKHEEDNEIYPSQEEMMKKLEKIGVVFKQGFYPPDDALKAMYKRQFMSRKSNFQKTIELGDIRKAVNRILTKTENKNVDEVINETEQFMKKYNDDVLVSSFLEGYKQLAMLGPDLPQEKLQKTFLLASQVDIIKSFGQSLKSEDRLDMVISIDTVAHQLHILSKQNTFPMYPILDELADISKDLGETNRDDRLLLLNSSSQDIMEKFNELEIFQKGNLFEQGKSYWHLMEKAIKYGVERLTPNELVILREWIFARI